MSLILKMTNEKINDEFDALVFRVSKNDLAGFLVFIVTNNSNRTFSTRSAFMLLYTYMKTVIWKSNLEWTKSLYVI